ncbi:hypothetical protein RvY_03752 [Ramazzottius varieornatus]|uniref:Fringe-like glycosyltransferase domain-containing protein n=1 Tax=Ramazzottius varieornatus TaxID=947166 RepID=A0A1D1UP71_RAMVA|nr:hypothetical protein RvY_03752 [Ramazzottius varieornatus]
MIRAPLFPGRARSEMTSGMRRQGLFNLRFLLLIAVLVLGLFGLLHYEPVRNKLKALVTNEKDLPVATQTQRNLGGTSLVTKRPLWRKGPAKVRKCPQDFRHMEGNFIFITIKTTEKYHELRLKLLITTWIHGALKIRANNNRSLVKVAVVSDAVDDFANKILGGRMIKSKCPSSHNKTDLCCKQTSEFDLYYAERDAAQWFCHFDDDNYVNIPNLVSLLERYNAEEASYLGKSSRARTRLTNVITGDGKSTEKPFVAFSFGTGGAGFCLSKAAMKKVKRHVSRMSGGNGLEGVCRRLTGLSDDVAVGYVSAYNDISLTEIPQMHSHLEKMTTLTEDEIRRAVSLSYTRYRSYENTVRIADLKSPFSKAGDPSRFLALYHFLKPRDCNWEDTMNS